MRKYLGFGFVFLLGIWACQSPQRRLSEHFFRYNQGEGLSSLDPAFARNVANIWATRQLFDGLVQFDKKLNVIPNLASRWEIDATQTQYTFYLRPNIFFHNHPAFGKDSTRKVTAQDVAFSLTRIVDSKVASPGAWVYNDKVLGVKAFQSGQSTQVEGFKVVNDSVFQIILVKQIGRAHV